MPSLRSIKKNNTTKTKVEFNFDAPESQTAVFEMNEKLRALNRKSHSPKKHRDKDRIRQQENSSEPNTPKDEQPIRTHIGHN